MLGYEYPYKICDSVHGFIRFDELEKEAINSRTFQRLRYITQMGVAYLLYPGATHSRFEHSLGVMELVSRLYDTFMGSYNLKKSYPWIPDPETKIYWRKILRLAALCHDMGHLPFSHTAEKELLPDGGHEKMTIAFIQSEELRQLWERLGPHAEMDILKLAISEKELAALGFNIKLTPWERVLSQVITDDNFGADRVDYLIRDALHTGVSYGHFDYHQLLDSVRILPTQASVEDLTLGIVESGIQSVESLWIARYLMYARVYHHSKARVYTHHMIRFMVRHYAKNTFPQSLDDYLYETDFVVLTAAQRAFKENDEDALILFKQKPPFKEISLQTAPSEEQLRYLQKEFQTRLIIDRFPMQDQSEQHPRNFSVLKENGEIDSSINMSTFLRNIPPGSKPIRLYAPLEDVEKIQKKLLEHK